MPPKAFSVAVLALTQLVVACRPVPEPVVPVVVDPVELRSFADDFFAERMDSLEIPGLAFVFVQQGEVIYAQAYGYADLEARTPVSADSTVMRIGSVSKAFVATAVMQLVEQGRLDLEADIRQYLPAPWPESVFAQPVTLAHLLTHTAGYEDPPYTSNTDPQQVRPLPVFLAESLPPPAHPPGEAFIYSNYGYALAALVVEEVSGTSFDQIVARTIFEPLGMRRTRYLLAPPLPDGMATGYASRDGMQVPQPMDYDSDYPGGSIVSTAEEMSHFLLAQLQGGCYRGTCILQAESLAQMHRRQAATPYEGQNVTYGFVEGTVDGVRLVGHSGAIRGFASNLDLLPEYDMGYFFAFNAECYETSACQIIAEFRTQFLERFFP